MSLRTHSRIGSIDIYYLVTPFVTMLEKEDASSGSTDLLSSKSTESTKKSKNMEQYINTKKSKSNDDVSTTSDIR